jgi:hypothetical protein
VIERLRPQVLAVIREVPADLVVLTGAVTSMARRERIDRRERRTLLRFADRAGWQVLGELRTPDEVGPLARPAPPVGVY